LFATQAFTVTVMTVVWVLYMLKSRRVKATFIR